MRDTQAKRKRRRFQDAMRPGGNVRMDWAGTCQTDVSGILVAARGLGFCEYWTDTDGRAGTQADHYLSIKRAGYDPA